MKNVYNQKPRVTEKIMEIARAFADEASFGKKNFAPSGFILNYSNKCNFKCPHCYTGSGKGELSESRLSVSDIKSLSDQADALGVYEIDIQGGEPLMYPNLFEILDALGLDRFYTYITTNGWLLTQELADKLAKAGVDRISVSIDSFSAETHDEFRAKQGSFERAFAALEYTKNAGMKPYVNVVIGHYNARSKELEDFCELIISKGYGIGFNCASPTGNWRGNYDAMLMPEDTKNVERIRMKHKEIIRDLWNYFNLKGPLVKGCPSVNLFYVNPLGDILPCPYIQAKLGNILEMPLKEILEYGFSFSPFNKYSSLCLSGEDLEFAKNYLDQDTSILAPVPVSQFLSI